MPLGGKCLNLKLKCVFFVWDSKLQFLIFYLEYIMNQFQIIWLDTFEDILCYWTLSLHRILKHALNIYFKRLILPLQSCVMLLNMFLKHEYLLINFIWFQRDFIFTTMVDELNNEVLVYSIIIWAVASSDGNMVLKLRYYQIRSE